HGRVITDVGIAGSREPVASVGKTIPVRGTVGYMAPEQTSGVVDPRSDQFGSAVVLYEMLTGYHPFDSTGGGPVIPPTTLNHELPLGLDAFITRALAPIPDQPYSDMMEFLHTLNSAMRQSRATRAVTPSLDQHSLAGR